VTRFPTPGPGHVRRGRVLGRVVRRLAGALVVAWLVISVTFAMLAAIPADPARAIVGPRASAETLARARAAYCLDRDLATRYGCFVARIARGDLGESFREGRPVATILGERAWPTAQLLLAALALQLGLGIPLGVFAARRDRATGSAGSAMSAWPARLADLGLLLAQSAPAFLVGTLAIYLVAYRLGWLPTSGYGTPGWDRLRHLVLPALTQAAAGIAFYAGLVRAGVREAIGADFVRTARAKGLSARAATWRHALPVALGPVIALAGLDLGAMLSGTVLVEAVFAWPGLGREVMMAVLSLDLPVILGAVLLGALAVTVGNLVADLARAALDPRVRE
jgi:ABC-type dipeptide/oligopeptide/nickel transport system permease component